MAEDVFAEFSMQYLAFPLAIGKEKIETVSSVETWIFVNLCINLKKILKNFICQNWQILFNKVTMNFF